MKTLLRTTALALALAATPAAFAADGEIEFNGTITANSCPITITNPGGAAGTVPLGNVSKSSLAAANDIAGAGTFSLAVTPGGGCTPGTRATVSFVSLSGSAGPGGEWLNLVGAGGAGVAQNVAVQIRDVSGNALPLGDASVEYDPTNPMRFTANYIATGAAVEGSADARAAFTVNYL